MKVQKSFQYGALWNKDPCWISHPLLWPLAKKFWSFSRDICQYTLPLSKSKLLIKGVVFLLHRTCSRCIKCCQWCTKNHTRPEWVREISWRFIIQWRMGLATQKLVHLCWVLPAQNHFANLNSFFKIVQGCQQLYWFTFCNKNHQFLGKN